MGIPDDSRHDHHPDHLTVTSPTYTPNLSAIIVIIVIIVVIVVITIITMWLWVRGLFFRNQTWEWKIHHFLDVFPIEASIYTGFPS